MERPLLGSLELQQAPRPWLQEESHKTVCALSNPITSTLQVPRTSEDMKKGACLSPLPLSLICPSCNARALQGLLFMLWFFFFHILITFYVSNCSRKTGKTNCFREPHFCDFLWNRCSLKQASSSREVLCGVRVHKCMSLHVSKKLKIYV